MANDFAVKFTTVPTENAEYFVGSEAILQWEYSSLPPDPVRKIKFGIVALPENKSSANEDVAIFVKDTMQGHVTANNKTRTDVIAPFNGRVSVLKNKTASFRIANLTFKDTGRYFCRLEPERSFTASEETHYVDLTVVDIMIDHQKSTKVTESWKGHKITLKCAVKKAFHDSKVVFNWEQRNRTFAMRGRPTSWKTMGQITFVTEKDDDFQPVTCIAETYTTKQRLEINITRLYTPSDPFNLKVQEFQSNDTKCKLYNKIMWEPPHDNGETPLMGYLLEFKHPVITSIFNRTTTHSTEHTICKVQDSSHPREMNVDVRGVNRVGRGLRSNTVKITFFSTPSAPFNVTSSLVRRKEPPFVARVSWNPPDESGGMPMIKYSVEYKVLGSPWKDAEVKETNNTQILINKYDYSYIYEVRVRARNLFGFGPSSEAERVSFAEKPGPPENLKRGEVFYDNQTPKLKLFWEPPKSDGGAEISHYIVEHKTVKIEWRSAKNASVNETEFAIPVEITETFTVRVRAVNSLGPSEPSDVLNVKLTEKDIETLARLNKSGSLTATGVFFLLLAVFHTLV